MLLAAFSEIRAQDAPPKREFRGVWIATVANIDWPSEQGLSTRAQQLEFTRILDRHQQMGINAVIVQVRPAADAIYAKSREPWSEWLSGVQGRQPDPFYDPLSFMIEEAHKRGMELHAWFNPYRAVFRADGPVAPDHITRKKPEWFFNYGGKKLFNPGIPEVRQYIVQVIMDVVRNYDIDGVHFDDYFYPYPVSGEHIPDAALYRKYAPGGMTLEDWRRQNVNLLISELQDSINSEKSYVKFGISPFGIWKNMHQDFEGSDTDGGSTYYHQFADSRRWVQEGWVDYIVPQIYFPFGHSLAPYDDLVLWWSENAFDRHLYIGLGAYRINQWRDRRQMPRQLGYARKYSEVGGVVFFSSNTLLQNPLGFADSLQNNYFRYPALPPAMPWKDRVPPLAPEGPRLEPDRAEGTRLSWTAPAPAPDGDTARGYVIYRFEQGQPLDTEDPRHIITVQFGATSYIDKTALPQQDYVYVITALDRLSNESVARCRISTQSLTIE